MREALLMFACLLLVNTVGAQYKFQLGSFSSEYLKMQVYDQDTGAAALVILDYGEFSFSSGFETDFLIHEQIKILKSTAYNEATITVPYNFAEKQKITYIKASSFEIKSDGQIVESLVEPEMVYDEDIDGEYHQKKFNIPNVKVGCVIEYTYTVHTTTPDFTPSWNFESEYPVIKSEFVARIPGPVQYAYLVKNPLGYVHQTQKSVTEYIFWQLDQLEVTSTEYHWVAENLPAFEEEKFMTSKEDYITQLSLHLQSVILPGLVYNGISSWDEVNERKMKEFFTDRQINGRGIINDKADSVAKNETDPLKKMQLIYDWVRTNISYSEHERTSSANDLNRTFKSRHGDILDIARILTLMLRDVDLKASPMYASTWSHGYPDQMYPSLSQFDYLLTAVQIDTTWYFLDPTDRCRPWNLPPDYVVDRQGLIIDSKHWTWNFIPANGKSKESITVSANLTTDGKLSGTMSIFDDGYKALETRRRYKASESKGQMIELYNLTSNPEMKIEATEVKNVESLSLPLTSSYTFTLSNSSDSADIIYFSPLLCKFLDDNPFKEEQRRYPVDFGYTQQYTYLANYTIPDQYTVDELPKNNITKLPSDLGEFKRFTEVDSNKISFLITMSIRRSHFDVDYYPALREFYDKFISVNYDQIVLKRKSMKQ